MGDAAASDPLGQGQPAQVSSQIRELWEHGRKSWSSVEISLEDFGCYVAARQSSGAGPLTAARAADLYLTCGCSAGNPSALSLFETAFLSKVPAFVSRLALPESTLAEVTQTLRTSLFVGSATSPAKIRDYSGQGALAGWLRVVAMRTALSLLRKRKDHSLEELGGDDQLMAATENPELLYLKNRYQNEFKEAFAAALAQLSSEQRNLLRLHLIDGMSIDKLGAVFQVHRATAARWLHSARESVFAETHRFLKQRLGLSQTELDSLVRVLRSQLDLSVARLLSESAP